jgi:hypothetical protein
MDIFKKMGKSVKKAGKAVLDEVKSRQEISRTKRSILHNFEMKDLKGICKAYGIGEPSTYVEDIITGEKSRRKVTREDYIDWIIEKLSLEQIKNFAQKHRIQLPETVKEPIQPLVIQPKTELETTAEVLPSGQAENLDEEKLKRIIAIIKEFSPKAQFKKEAEYENTLFTRLQTFFPEIEFQVPYANSRIDIKIGGFGIEIKNHPDQNEINRLVGQLISYKRFFKHVIIVIFNPRDDRSLNYLKKIIKEYELAASVISK